MRKITRHTDTAGACIVVTDNPTDRPKLRRRQFVNIENRLTRDRNQDYSRFVRSLDPGTYKVIENDDGSFSARRLTIDPLAISVRSWKRVIHDIESRQWESYWKERGII